MRRISKVLVWIALLLLFTASTTLAVENEYLVVKTVEYRNNNNRKLEDGYIKIMLGQLNFTQYAKDEYMKITPRPTRIETDDLENLYAYYSTKGMVAHSKITITLERKMKVSDFGTEQVIPARSNGSVTAENKKFVEPQEKIESNHQKIIDKANELTTELTTDYRKAAAIFEYVNKTISYDVSSSYANKGALSALETSKGVCEEYATLFVALCRAEEIPARVIAGYKVEMGEEGECTLIDHTWAEIYLDDYGWVPVEPTILYSINGERMAYWNTFCALNDTSHIPTELYYAENANREYQYVTEVNNSFTQKVYVDDKIVEPEQNHFLDLSAYDWAGEAIQTLYELGIVKGYSEREYGPERNISRIEFITMLSRTLKHKGENVDTSAKGIYYYPSYNLAHWSREEYDYLMRVYQFYTPSDIMSAGFQNLVDVFGVGADLEKAITRGEALALMDLFMGEVNTWNAFKDVPVTNRYAGSIAKAYSSGIITGYPDGTFRPNSTITRAEMACVLGRYVMNDTCVIE